jgi:hypothetical membrane protein
VRDEHQALNLRTKEGKKMSPFDKDAKPLDHRQSHIDSLERGLVSCGALAGPLFLAAAIVQGLIRPGFDLDHQPISFLSVGRLGWVQQSNFVLAGLLMIAFAIGVRRVCGGLSSRRLAPIALGGLGIGLIIAGVFAPDPGFGYPPGTPDGPPKHLTYHSTLHGLGFTLSFICFAVACIVFAREAARRGNWFSVSVTAAAAVVAVALAVAPGNSTVAVRDLVAAGILWSWIGVQSLRLLQTGRYGSERPYNTSAESSRLRLAERSTGSSPTTESARAEGGRRQPGRRVAQA